MKETQDQKFLIAFGKHLKKVRTGKDLSQEELAFRSEIPYSQISRIERAKINTTIDTVYKISQALGVKISDLFDFDSQSIQ